jgi:eukaryotic-like serine/threonine-protein kinase
VAWIAPGRSVSADFPGLAWPVSACREFYAHLRKGTRTSHRFRTPNTPFVIYISQREVDTQLDHTSHRIEFFILDRPWNEGSALAIVCPYCAYKLNLKSPKPGRFRPRCPACNQAFGLTISDQPGVTIKVRALTASTSVARRAGEITHGQPLEHASSSNGEREASQVVIEPVSHSSSRIAFGEFSHGVPERPHAHLTNVAQANPVRSEQLDREPVRTEGPQGRIRLECRGYSVERELGRGGMGTVYLARQLSLDRPVALKVMSNRWAADPVFVARFTREAYAAAQLSHPNIVQIHDIGETAGTRFFSMEFVAGRTLADLIKLRGKLDPETAVGYVLQAARGLKHAHERGMIHRDVKPDNLLIDNQGLVKVADLGLVKTPSINREEDQISSSSSSSRSGLNALPPDMTGARIALGTPAYMSPEQCRDAASVDHRADIYSLGCTLYVLVTGRPPFDGTTAVELMTKHAYDPLVPPEQIVSRVPKEISAVIQKMMEKHADDRYQSMGEVIRTLEAWLGVQHTGTFSPHEEQIARLEGYVSQFNNAPTAVLKRRILTGFFATFSLCLVLIAFFGKLVWAFGLLGLVVQTGLVYFVLDGIARRGPLFRRTRQFLFGLSWGDWAVVAASMSLFYVLLAMLNVLWMWTGFGLIGVGLAFALRYGLDRPSEEERLGAVDMCERMLARLRSQGLDEEEIQQFVAKFAGRDWEEFFEALFGYEAKLKARTVLLRGGSAGAREKFAAWREPIIATMDRIEKLRKAMRERRLLQAVERAQLLAVGISPERAEINAVASANAMVEAAGQIREAEEQRIRGINAYTAGQPPVNVRAAVIAPEENAFAFVSNPKPDAPAMFVNLFVGPHVRATLAAVLLAACGMWVHQNALMPGAEMHSQAAQAVETGDFSDLQQTAARGLNKHTQPLAIAGVPQTATMWVDSWNVGVAGMLLLCSLFVRGNVMAVFALLGTAVVAVGHQYGIRTVEPFQAQHVSLMLGSVLALVGFRFAR